MNDQFAFLLADPDGRIAAVGMCPQGASLPVGDSAAFISFTILFQRVGHIDAEEAAKFKAEWQARHDLRHVSLKPWRGCFVELFYPAWWQHSPQHFLELALADMFDDLKHGAFVEPNWKGGGKHGTQTA